MTAADKPAQKFIVLASNGIGGAEKRFFDIYRSLVETDHTVHFVAPDLLIDKLDLAAAGPQAARNVIRLEMLRWSMATLLRSLYRLIRNAPSGSIFHYPLNPLFFLHLLRRHRVSISLCDCTRIPRINWWNKNDLLEYAAMHFVDRVDVLSPAVHEELQRRLSPRTAGKLSLTPQGTYVNPEGYHVAQDKRRDVIYLSRLEEQKGILDWLDLLPELWLQICSRSWAKEMRFLICGAGTLEKTVTRRVEELCACGIPVRFLGMMPPADLFAHGRVVVSLQRHTNFPSRVVAEARLSGCTVLIRDTGDSRKFGAEEGIRYIAPLLDADEVRGVLDPLLSASVAEALAAAHGIRNEAVKAMARSKSIEYFRGILGGGTR